MIALGKSLAPACVSPSAAVPAYARYNGQQTGQGIATQVQFLAAPGEVMVPWNEPEVKNVTGLAMRSMVKVPWAPAKRPVPPVMVKVSVILKTRPSGVVTGSPDPVIVIDMLSPLAAIH